MLVSSIYMCLMQKYIEHFNFNCVIFLECIILSDLVSHIFYKTINEQVDQHNSYLIKKFKLYFTWYLYKKIKFEYTLCTIFVLSFYNLFSLFYNYKKLK